MAAEPQKRLGSRSPPPWHRQSYPHPSSTTTATRPPPSSRPESLKTDAPLEPIPAPRYLDLSPVKTEKELLDTRPQSTSLSTTPATSLTSPASMYSLGPPPPYSSCLPAQPVTASTTGPASQTSTACASSPAPRRESREDIAMELQRQSLPSISEALKLPPLLSPRQTHQQTPHVPPSSFPQPGILNAASNPHTAAASPTLSRSHVDSQQPSSLSSFSSQQSPHITKPPDPGLQRLYTHNITDSPRPAHQSSYSSQAPSPTDIHARRVSPGSAGPSTSAPSQSYVPGSVPPPVSYSRPPHPTTTAPSQYSSYGPPTHTAAGPTSGYSDYRPPLHAPPSGFSFPPPQTSGNSYEQHLSLGSQQHLRTMKAELDKVEEQRRAAAASHTKRPSYGGAGYGLTVKRHLDDFDLENSLNEIAQRTQQVLEFSRAYGTEAYKYGRTPLPISQLPDPDKMSDMIGHSHAITEALLRLQGTIEGMNHAAAAEQERQQEQQQRESALAKASMYQSHPGHAGYGMHPGPERLDDRGDVLPGGGFTNGDPKKPRRGRNAPPGRCHSCNRAETPEWRRGPDGARTLCNACGLHYAKLTRKMGTKPGQSAGSNLRPKDGEDTTT